MNKKLLFAAMSLAALTACTDNDIESVSVAQQEASSVVFEVINGNDAMTRASMNGNKVAWSAEDGAATLTTPSMILPGAAIMVWPVDTAFTILSGGNLAISVPEVQPADIENSIPYLSDQILIGAYNGATGAANTAGYQREYPIYMRPMASQLNLKTDYAGTDATIAQLYEGGSACPADGGIEPISLTSVGLVADENNDVLTTSIPVKFTDPGDGSAGTIKKQWNDAVTNNAWGKITDFDKANIAAAGQVKQLTTKCIQGVDGCKLLILPLKANMSGTGTEESGVIVNTLYGKVIVAEPGFVGTKYNDTEIADAWYRFIGASSAAATGETKAAAAETSGDNAGKFKTTANITDGVTQTLNGFSSYNATSGIVKGEPVGAAATRYVKVLLDKLDMDGLHIQNDKHLRDAILVWNHLKAGDVKVYLDGDKDKEFEMSQSTIALINEINAAAAKEETPRKFEVKPCNVAGEACETIVVTGGGNIQNMAFILVNGTDKADVVLAEGETWEWAASETAAKTLTLSTATGVKSIINKGTFVSGATATLDIYDNATPTPAQITAVPFANEGIWNVTAGDVNVQFDVTNLGTVNISKGAEYHQDGTGNVFTNDANTLEERFVINDPSISAVDKAAFVEQIGVVNNSGVFATVHSGKINNYGLIEHADKDAKTYISANQTLSADGFTADAIYTSAFNPATSGAGNKMGRINLPYSNRDEDNVSISAGAAATGFVSLTVSTEGGSAPTGGKLDLTTVGYYVNYCIINSGVTEISKVSNQIKYLEFNAGTTEIAWNLGGTPSTPKAATYEGLIVLSPVNIKLWTDITVNSGTYLGAKMYVGGGFTNTGGYSAYYGKTAANEATMYITY